MAFKLGNKPLPGIAREGNINKKHKFKVERKKLAPGINGEAFPGKVVVDKSIKPGSAKDKIVISHEGQHVKDMASGKAAFGDDWVRWEGKTYQRKDGKVKYNGKWKNEGDHSFPWEKSAMKAESPLKHSATLKDHQAENPQHLHDADQYLPPVDTSKKDNDAAKADLEKNKSTRSPKETAHLLRLINGARAEKGLSPVATIMEGLDEPETRD
jgi:hypothetical protein